MRNKKILKPLVITISLKDQYQMSRILCSSDEKSTKITLNNLRINQNHVNEFSTREDNKQERKKNLSNYQDVFITHLPSDMVAYRSIT